MTIPAIAPPERELDDEEEEEEVAADAEAVWYSVSLRWWKRRIGDSFAYS